MVTAARFKELKEGATPINEEEQRELERLLKWERKSIAAKKAVQTKRRIYKRWPTRKGDHK